MQPLSRDWKLSTFIGPELISAGLHKTRSSTSALLIQTCLISLVISSTHFFSGHTCPCPQWAPAGKWAVEQMISGFTSTIEVFWQREEVSIENRLRKKYPCTNTGSGKGHWAGGAGAVAGRRGIAFAMEAFLKSGDVLVCRQWVQRLHSATVFSCNHSYQPCWG